MMNQAVFTQHPETKTLTVERTFDAPVADVWRAWTERELLEKWWAPAPWQAVTKSFDFREGGHWHYAMQSPEGEQHWCWLTYTTIVTEAELGAQDFFCDENGNRDDNLPGTQWHNVYEEQNGKTRAFITLTFVSAEDMEQLVDMGFKDGFSMALDQLETLLGVRTLARER